MTKLSAYALAIAIFAGTAATTVASHEVFAPHSRGPEAYLALDGAYRDGLYIGRLNAGRGELLRPPVGRWSNEKDRTSFRVGYRRGYNDALASATVPTRNTDE